MPISELHLVELWIISLYVVWPTIDALWSLDDWCSLVHRGLVNCSRTEAKHSHFPIQVNIGAQCLITSTRFCSDILRHLQSHFPFSSSSIYSPLCYAISKRLSCRHLSLSSMSAMHQDWVRRRLSKWEAMSPKRILPNVDRDWLRLSEINQLLLWIRSAQIMKGVWCQSQKNVSLLLTQTATSS